MSMNMPGNAWINCSDYVRSSICLLIIYIWQGFEYTSGIKYARLLNILWYSYNNTVIVHSAIILEFLPVWLVHPDTRQRIILSFFNTSFFFLSPSGFFFHKHSRIKGLQGKGEGISLIPHYHFHLLHRYLDISWAITVESSPRHIASRWTWTRNL